MAIVPKKNTQVVLHDYEKAPLIFETRGLPQSKAAQQKWADSMDDYRGSKVGVVVQCEKGYVVSTDTYATVRAFGPDGRPMETWRGGGDHFGNFLDAVRSRNAKLLNAPILEGYHSSALCLTGNISHVLGEPRTANEILDSAHGNDLLRDSLERMISHLRANEIEVDRPLITAGVDLKMNPVSEQFTNSGAANELLRRQDRKSFAVPEIA